MLAASMLGAESGSIPDPGAEVRSLTLSLVVSKIEATENDGLRIFAEGTTKTENKKWGLVLTIPGGRLKKTESAVYDSHTHRRLSKEETAPVGSYEYGFPVFLEPSKSGATDLDRLLTFVFGKGKPATLFQAQSYSGTAFLTPKEFGHKGGRILLRGGDWALSVELGSTKCAKATC